MNVIKLDIIFDTSGFPRFIIALNICCGYGRFFKIALINRLEISGENLAGFESLIIFVSFSMIFGSIFYFFFSVM